MSVEKIKIGNTEHDIYAARSTADASGNTITSTYATKSELNTAKSNLQASIDGKSDKTHTHNYAGSSSAGGSATSANKVNNSLTVKLNSGSTEGRNMFTFNGSATKSVNITPSSIGAATSNHTHDDRYYTESEVDTKLSGKANSSHGNHVPATQTANNAKFLRNDNTWQTVSPANIGAMASNPSFIELWPGTTAGHGGVIDFHYNGSTSDYTSRIIEYPSGTLLINGVSLKSGTVTGNLNGNADTAKNVAWSGVTSKPSYYDAKAIKGIKRSGTTFTYTRMDGTTGTFTQQNYSAATSSALGLVKIGSNISVSSGTISLTKANVTAALGYTPPTSNTTYKVVTASTNGLVPMFDAVDGTIDSSSSDWVLTNNNGSIGWYKLPANAFKNTTYTSLKNPYSLTIQGNGTTLTNGTYDGSAAKTVNITPSAIGAAASSHTHSYLPLTGGSITGAITINGTNDAKTSPTAQELVINGKVLNSSTNLVPKNAPGIGFHSSNKDWGNFLFDGTFKFMNNNFTGFLPIQTNTVNCTRINLGNSVFTYDSTNKRLVISVS